jgi:hypothetical protein
MPGVLAALRVALLTGCDTEIHVQPEIDLGTRASEARGQERLDLLEAEVLRHEERAQPLQARREEVEGENVILHGPDGITFRLNTPSAVVLVVALLCATFCFAAKLRYRPEGEEPA